MQGLADVVSDSGFWDKGASVGRSEGFRFSLCRVSLGTFGFASNDDTEEKIAKQQQQEAPEKQPQDLQLSTSIRDRQKTSLRRREDLKGFPR